MTASFTVEPPPLTVVGVAIGTYEYAELYEPLAKTVALVQEVAGRLSNESSVISDPCGDDVRRALDKALPDGGLTGRGLIVVWSGHGANVQNELRFVTRDTKEPTQNGTYPPSALAELAVNSGAEQILLIVDTCYAGAGLVPVLSMADRMTDAAGQTPSIWFGVLAATVSYTEAVEGALLSHVRDLFRQSAPNACAAVWSPHNRYLRGDEVLWGLVEAWGTGGNQRPHQATKGHARPLLENPRYSPGGEFLVAHLLAASRGADPGEEAWYFSGRRGVLRQLVDRMAVRQPGLVVVTGPAGCGKSAVLGRIAALSDRAERRRIIEHAPLAAADPDPGEHAVDATVNLRNKAPQEVIVELAGRLGSGNAQTIYALMDWAVQQRTPPVLVVDGLDEAGGQARLIAADIIRLSEVCCILVATRPFESGAALAAQEESLPQLLAAPSTLVVDLGETGRAEIKTDIEEYVGRRLALLQLTAGQLAAAVERITGVAVDDAEGGAFLLARALTTHVQGAPLDIDRLSNSIEEAFDRDLAQWPELTRDGVPIPGAARHLLYALAFAAGGGLPARDVWPTVATALRDDGFEFGEADVYTLLGSLGDSYGRYVMSSSEGEQAVYRLYHRRLVDHLRGKIGIGDERLVRVFAALKTLAERQLREGQ
ncbi:hypothetical protein Val02_85340 [Virgisporangium aliadipatigenens]|uniref:AAA+ ATPase domain-containing protein n=1 Tax=Virgisporangium aliadipatigenens TaxID=741659 RepID=A0A8J3YW57_9ACTN|nr:ATP-binding protein [Virgisporangium aliadipatigenens]GIJ51648.1 hypothetical protein Val02_85340 [Virgisporangium aliadipatigenens]